MPWVRASLPSVTQGSFQTPLGLLLAQTESGRVKAKLHVQKCYFSPASKESPTPDAFWVQKKQIISDGQLKHHNYGTCGVSNIESIDQELYNIVRL